MFRALVLFTASAPVLAAACAPVADTSAPTLVNGWKQYTASRVTRTIPCDNAPVLLSGNRTTIRLTGPCRQVLIQGEHNDIAVDTLPGSIVEITGAHNDVTWSQIAPGRPPQLIDRGVRNSFHRGRA